jgi:DNA-binding NtrC family response regulator
MQSVSSDTAPIAAAQPSPTLLIVDDDRDFARSAADFARSHGYQPYLAHSLEQSHGFAQLPVVDLLLLDLDLPDGNGIDLLDDQDLPELGHVAIVTGHPSVETAARAVAKPIADYLVKPLSPEQFKGLLERAAQPVHARLGEIGRSGMIGDSPAMRRLIAQLEQAAPSNASVLLSGESGTGKELAARAVHRLSGRAGPFVAVNCGAIAPDLLASHLFGHERGSFTGASSRHCGYFEQAAGGTLFLDEIAEMPAALQVYLLRVLEAGSLTRVGGTEEVAIDVRVVAATNRDPLRALADGALREDLYYRLADFHLELPPLRSRGDDAMLIARSILHELNARYGTHKRFVAGTEAMIAAHRWPGNVRELRSAIQRAFLTAAGAQIRIAPAARKPAATAAGPDQVNFSVGMTYAQIEQEMLLRTLAHFDNDRTRAARALGVSVRTIHNQIARLRESGHEVD